MRKETFYFSHDYNARTDAKIKNLIRKHNMFGYGVYWAIIEDLYQNNNVLPLDYDLIAYELRTEQDLIKSVIEDFDLFTIKDNIFGSISVEKRLLERDNKSKVAKDNARKRWGEDDSRKKSINCTFYILRLSNNDESFIKCGITTESISRRYSGKTKNYTYTILYQQEMTTIKAIDLENLVDANFTKYTPKQQFGGYLECYKTEDESKIINLAMQCESDGNAIKESKGNESKENKDEYTFVFKSALVELGIEPKIVSEWLKVRKNKKLTNSETAFISIKKEIQKSGLTPNECIKIAVEKSWGGIDAEWLEKYKPKPEENFFTKMGIPR
jgi:hypothetical protein